ncbi:MAG TPA: DASS family sodium-coupled anion symporter [Saprospiraceae bacterium]|nr:DASS family sodium-coupled anion symporter [Saprospiraceae bacterium]HMQ83636.1 DASS family sodium-coupled anion symporter [Saprospiraceae bacterium]
MKNQSAKIGLFLGPLLFVVILLFCHPEGMSREANAILAGTVWVAVWWITEALPIAVTALLPIVLFPTTGGLSLSDTTESFGHKFVFLYVGGFIIAIAIEKWGLHKRIALNIIRLIGTNVSSMILGFMVATAFLSMWISNTATAVMMLPIGMAIVAQLRDNPATREDENQIFGKALMLSIAYSSSIGGIATLIGTPPNLVLAGVLEETYKIEITFAQWIVVGLPIAVLLLFICWKYLTSYAFQFKQKNFPGGRDEIERQLRLLGPTTFEEKMVMGVFAFTALAWISRSFLLEKWIPGMDDTIISMFGAIILFVLPASKAKGGHLLDWESAVKLPWGVLFLFGGGLAIAAGFEQTGLANWIGQQMSLLQGIALIFILLILIASVNFLTEITSNLATTAMILPVLAAMALTIDVHPFTLMIGATIAASCAFMLPVATPPNAIVFASGYLTIPDMMRTGFILNIISIIIVTLLVYFALPLMWGFEPVGFPEGLKEVLK